MAPLLPTPFPLLMIIVAPGPRAGSTVQLGFASHALTAAPSSMAGEGVDSANIPVTSSNGTAAIRIILRMYFASSVALGCHRTFPHEIWTTAQG
jgi:hypothetical protein